MRDKSNPTVEQIVGTLGKIFDKLPVKPEADLTFSLAFIRAVAHLREMQLEEAETRIEQLEEQVANSSFAKAEEYRVELEATQALLENGILWKAVGRIAEGRKSEGGISETVINEIAKRLIGSLVPPGRGGRRSEKDKGQDRGRPKRRSNRQMGLWKNNRTVHCLYRPNSY